MEVSFKSFLVVKTFSMENCRLYSLHWNIDSPLLQMMLFIMFHLDIELSILRNEGLCIFHHGLCLKFETFRDRLTNQTIDFFLASESWFCESSKIYLYFWFILAFKLIFVHNYRLPFFHQHRSRKVFAFGNISDNNYAFCSLQLTFDSPKMSGSIFQYGVFSIFQPGFPHFYQLEMFWGPSRWNENAYQWRPDWIFLFEEIFLKTFCRKKSKFRNQN